MISPSFLESSEYQELKKLLNETVLYRAIDIETKGKTNEIIAREVTAYELAAKLVQKAIRKFERSLTPSEKKQESWE